MSVTLRSNVVADILAHARDETPRECCGLLVGSGASIERSVRARNIAEDPSRRYLIDPADHFAAIRAARAESLDVVGAYHSHPFSDPVPSEVDLAEANHGAKFIYMIASLVGEVVCAYTIDNGHFSVREISVRRT